MKTTEATLLPFLKKSPPFVIFDLSVYNRLGGS